MRAKRTLLVVLTLGLLSSSAGIATSLAPTQLEGVRGAFVISFVSQYLPPEAKALENELKATAQAVLTKGGLNTTGAEHQYLVIDASGEALPQCPGFVLLTVTVKFKEAVSLKRAPSQPLPNSAITTWEHGGSSIVPEAEVVSSIRSRVLYGVEYFVELVQSMNPSLVPAKQ